MRFGLNVRTCNPLNDNDAAAYERLSPGATFAHLLSMPGYSVDKGLFLAEIDNTVVGYVNVIPELPIGRVILEYGISEENLPNIISGLFDKAIDWARSIGAKVAHVNMRSLIEEEKRFLSSLGFCIARRHYEMISVLPDTNHDIVAPPSLAFSRLHSGEENVLTQIQNSCFEGSWGYNPNSIEDIRWHFSVKNNSPSDIILVISEGRVIGYCWTVPNCGQDIFSNKRKGRIHMMGIHPEFRSKGIGRMLLKTGLSYLQCSGVEIVELTVDSQNVAAIELYESLGFHCYQETLWYEKIIDKFRTGNQ